MDKKKKKPCKDGRFSSLNFEVADPYFFSDLTSESEVEPKQLPGQQIGFSALSRPAGPWLAVCGVQEDDGPELTHLPASFHLLHSGAGAACRLRV